MTAFRDGVDDLPEALSYAAARERHMQSQSYMHLDDLGLMRLEQMHPVARPGVHIKRRPIEPLEVYDRAFGPAIRVGTVLALLGLGCIALAAVGWLASLVG